MSLFIRCEWIPPADSSLDARVMEIANLFNNPMFTAIAGAEWYLLGRSKAEALSKPMRRAELVQLHLWRCVPLIQGKHVYACNLWNGRDDLNSVNISIALHVPPEDPDTFVISGLSADNLCSSGVSWRAILDLSILLAETLGGAVRVSSHELLERGAELLAADAQKAVYAAFWGIDRSGRNPAYRSLLATERDIPFSCVSADSWEEVFAPNPARMRDITIFLNT